MAETILRILEFSSDQLWSTHYRRGWRRNEAGFVIFTNEQEIVLAIEDEQSCCESWGYFLTEDDTEKFIGAKLRGVTVTDTNRSSKTFLSRDYSEPLDRLDRENIDLDCGNVMFVDIETNRGVLQFVAYNAHNGYYGHAARVASRQLTEEVIV